MSWNRSMLILILIMFCKLIFAQHENDRWIFGGAPFPTNPPALNFFTGTPVPVSTTPVSSFWSTEAAAAVANQVTGALFFYTDGSNVFTANHTLMPEGGATFTTKLSGCVSTTQGALILPRPGMSGHYYIFTLDCNENYTSPSYSGLRFSEVDMSLNGGLGDVIPATRNTLLWGPPANAKLTEKLTATRHTNGTDYWLVVHEWASNRFLSFAVTCNGISFTPVTSATGTVHNSASQFPEEIIGAMKISPNRSRLALVARGTLNLIEIFAFNPTTGVVSNPITLAGNGNDYGIEFSPNSNLMYVTVYNSTPCCSGTIFQYNLAGGTAASIQASKFQVVASGSVGYGGIQLGPDQKIHISRALQTNNLGIINSPNNTGNACGFSNTGANLSLRRSNIGLINVVPFQVNPVCLTLPVELIYFNASYKEPHIELEWQTASEVNNDYFSVQHSGTGADFKNIGTVKGTGNSTQVSEYAFADMQPLAGHNYYRLLQTDYNGEQHLLKTISVLNAGGPAYVYLNSGNSYLELVFNEFPGNFEMEILNTFGVVQWSGRNQNPIDVSNLVSGVYFIIIHTNNQSWSRKFIRL